MFIAHTLIYRENGFHDAIFHVVVFAVLLVGLTVFSVYFAADDSGTDSGSSMPGDPRCYYNGVKLGTPTNVPKVGNVIVYTADECKKLGGTMPIEPGTCVIANGDSQNVKQIYSYFCSTDPTILALTKK